MGRAEKSNAHNEQNAKQTTGNRNGDFHQIIRIPF